MVFEFANHALNATVYNQHSTGAARRHAAIQSASFQRDTKSGGLANGILLGMYCAYAMVCNLAIFVGNLFKQMPDFVAMRQTNRGAYIACNQDLLVPGNYTAASPAIACGTLGDGARYFHEIFVPGWAYVRGFWFCSHFLNVLKTGKGKIILANSYFEVLYNKHLLQDLFFIVLLP
jgi:hypothetical protein